jgi:hypothetical protein
MLRAFCKTYADLIMLVFPGSKELPLMRELADGDFEYVFPIHLPSAQWDSWDDTNCKQAFEEVAEIWGLTEFDTIAAMISGIELTETEFTNWIHTQGHNRPIFWAESTSESSLSIDVPPTIAGAQSQETEGKEAGKAGTGSGRDATTYSLRT